MVSIHTRLLEPVQFVFDTVSLLPALLQCLLQTPDLVLASVSQSDVDAFGAFETVVEDGDDTLALFFDELGSTLTGVVV